MVIPDRVIERLSGYRRHLRDWHAAGHAQIFSHELANLEGATPAQVRRDLMTIGYTGSPARGYDVVGLVGHIDEILKPEAGEGIALVGAGHLGGAILDYFGGRHAEYHVVAAFDIQPDRVNRVVHGHRCYSVDELEAVLAETPATVGILTVPAEAAQPLATRLVAAGVGGLVNFTAVRLQVPPGVYVENVDISLTVEKVAFFARTQRTRREAL
jgi:redox-sensing transcriptional repressor